MASATAIVTDLLAELDGRKGWDEYRESIDPNVFEELEGTLINIVDEHLDGHREETRHANTVSEIKIIRKGWSKKLFDGIATTENGQQFRLPLTGLSYVEPFGDRGHVGLNVSSHRVTFEDID